MIALGPIYRSGNPNYDQPLLKRDLLNQYACTRACLALLALIQYLLLSGSDLELDTPEEPTAADVGDVGLGERVWTKKPRAQAFVEKLTHCTGVAEE